MFLFHSFYCFYVIFILLSCFIFSFLHFPLSGPVLTNISLPIIPCMIVYVTNNKEPWTLNLEPWVNTKMLGSLEAAKCKNDIILFLTYFMKLSVKCSEIKCPVSGAKLIILYHNLCFTCTREFIIACATLYQASYRALYYVGKAIHKELDTSKCSSHVHVYMLMCLRS